MIDTDIAVFERLEGADALRAELVREGFDSVVVADRGGLFSVLAQVEEPEHVLKASGRRDLEGAVKCPECGGTWVAYPARPQASPTAAGVQKVLDAVGGAVAGLEAHAHCNSCAHEWTPEKKR